MGRKLKVLTLEEFALLEDKDPEGAYDRETREALYKIIQKLGDHTRACSRPEKKIYKRFSGANLGILLCENTEYEGKILHPGGLRVEGRFKGEIVIKETLTVEPSGRVDAKVSAGTVVCRGIIEGEIQALNRVLICRGGRVTGDIFTPSIHVEQGAFFDGRCAMPHQPQEFAIQQNPQKRKLSSAG